MWEMYYRKSSVVKKSLKGHSRIPAAVLKRKSEDVRVPMWPEWEWRRSRGPCGNMGTLKDRQSCGAEKRTSEDGSRRQSGQNMLDFHTITTR